MANDFGLSLCVAFGMQMCRVDTRYLEDLEAVAFDLDLI